MDMFNAGTQDLPRVELGKRHFTVEQANQALVLVRKIIADVLDAYQRVLDEQELLEIHHRAGDVQSARAIQTTIILLVEQLQSYSDELVEIGAEMKDWATGMVDFPSFRDGREIQLCWCYGEPDILHWHEIDDGCGGRQALTPVTTHA